jgi:eukaryotic-like serine/threonine-protein kinase
VSDSATQIVQPGDILAEKFRVERVLGQGGMGVVVLAEHIELRERVAIKFLLDAPADNAELAERFIREARAAVRIKSEHVVRVVDVGRLPTGAPYMVMEYLEGEDLSERLLSGAVPIEDAVDYVIQACEAMNAAHRLGIVHRDLKPANLFLTERPDGSSLIKVLDFGISKVKTHDPSQMSLTHTQAMMGSPLYMSPEQMRSSKDVSPSADIWSLGVILHELISGDVPFTGSTFPEVLVQVMSDAPARLRSLRAEVPEGLEAVVLRCLEKDPADRYSSVAALGVALSPYASPRTLGLQARLRTSATNPPVAPLTPSPVIIRAAEVIRIQEGGAATAPTAPAPPPPAGALPDFIAVPGDRSPSRTNTAWGEQVATGPQRAGSLRRRWLVGASALVVCGLLGVAASSALRSPSEPSSSAAPAALPASVAAPAASSPANEAPARPREPQIRPALDAPAVPATTDATPAAPAAAADPLAPTSPAAPTPSAAGVTSISAADEHTVVASPTATTAGQGRVAAPKERAASRTAAQRSSEKTARVRVGAPPPKPVTNAQARPAAKPVAKASASTPTRSKPLSIDFK